MPQSPRRNSQTQTNWADHLSANRYAAGAVVALLAAYVVAGRGEPPSYGLYRSGEYDDEASELRHRRERLLALRRKREGAAAAADGV